MGDCAATVELFHRMMAMERAADVVAGMLKRGERESRLPQHVPASDFEALPTAPGVYRFLNQRARPSTSACPTTCGTGCVRISTVP